MGFLNYTNMLSTSLIHIHKYMLTRSLNKEHYTFKIIPGNQLQTTGKQCVGTLVGTHQICHL